MLRKMLIQGLVATGLIAGAAAAYASWSDAVPPQEIAHDRGDGEDD